MDHRLIGQLVNRDAVRARYGDSFKEIVRLLTVHGITGLPVVDGDGKVLGVISRSDMMFQQAAQEAELKRWYARRRLTGGARAAHARARSRTAGQLMTSPAVTVGVHQNVTEAVRLMAASKVDRLPVVDEAGRLIGLVTRSDLLKVFLRSDDEIRAELITEVLVRVMGLDPNAVEATVRAGVVTLDGRLPLRDQVPLTARLASRIDGVVAVVDRLEYLEDDTKGADFEESVRARAREWLRGPNGV